MAARDYGAGLRVLGLAALGLSISGAAYAQTPFTNWSDVLKPGATVAVGGVAQEFTTSSGPNGVSAASAASTNMAVTFTESFTPAGDLASLEMKNANRTVTFVRANGDTIKPIIGDKLIYGLSTDWARKALAADPLINGWKYQSFGVWVNGLGMTQGSMGSASVGAITAGTSVPQTGSATFAGLMAGIYNDAVGQDHLLSADMGLAVNFGAHTADFWTVNTKDSLGADYADLNITGYFVSLPNHPAIFGQLSSKTLFGTTSGQFYGPGGEEVGGVVTMTPKSGTGLERFAAAYGGKLGTPVAKPVNRSQLLTGWSAVWKPSTTIDAPARILEASAELANPDPVRSTTQLSQTRDGSFSLTLDEAGAVTAMTRGGSTSSSFSRAAGDTIIGNGSMIIARAADGTRTAIVANPIQAGWEYQSFGAWESGVGLSKKTLNGISIGVVTPLGAVPTGGSATFNGMAGGIYIDAGVDVSLTGKATAAVDFGKRSIELSTTDFHDRDGRDYGFLNFSGPVPLNPGMNLAGGYVRNDAYRHNEAGMIGFASASFFGPNAQELGGTFNLQQTYDSSLKTTVTRSFVGGFGMRR